VASRAWILWYAVAIGGCSTDAIDAAGGGTGNGSASEESSGDAVSTCAPEVPSAQPLGVVDITVRNTTSEVAWVVGRVPEFGSDVEVYALVGPDGEPIVREAAQCVPSCADEEVRCPTQCNGAHDSAVAIDPGAVLQVQWSGLVQQWFDLPPGCDDASACGDRCVDLVPAPAGHYEIRVRMTAGCTTPGGDPCECELCAPLYSLEVPELVAEIDYQGPTSVSIDFTGND
jgi:hypothetical protein